jgi:methylmalonyl-CoA/ethylmalonyl-CoA epimerase
MEASERRVQLKPHHGAVSVPDLESSMAWYRDMLGFTFDSGMDLPDGTGKLVMMRNGDFIVELFEIRGAAPLPEDRRTPERDLFTHGVKHLAFAVPDVTALMDDLKCRGVDLAWDVVEIGGTKAAFVRDNAGNLIELMERPDYFTEAHDLD